jgi:hypothetical protein
LPIFYSVLLDFILRTCQLAATLLSVFFRH